MRMFMCSPSFSGPTRLNDTMRPFLIDTDPGIDDALALLLAFGSPECRVEAITTVAGNVEVPFCTRNARRVVAVAAPIRPPRIVEGAALDAALERAPRRLADFVSSFTRFAFRVEAAADHPGLTLHDPLAVGVALAPSFVTFERVRLEIGADGETRRRPGPPNCRVALAVEADRFVPWFLERLCRASSS